MFGLAMTFLLVALIAGALGFGAFVGTVFAAAKIVFVVALLAFLVSALVGLFEEHVLSAAKPDAAGGRSRPRRKGF